MKGFMTKVEILIALDEALELEPGTLTGAELVDEIPTWDSVSLVNIIALADSKAGIQLSPRQIAACRKIDEVVALISPAGA
jgi:acyl carrier protein